jgi:hypothetical protein
MRTVTIRTTDKEIEFDPADRKFQAAIGYLSMWAFGSERYVNVQLAYDRDGCIDAVYSDKDGRTTYVIGGIRDEKSGDYSFHS